MEDVTALSLLMVLYNVSNNLITACWWSWGLCTLFFFPDKKFYAVSWKLLFPFAQCPLEIPMLAELNVPYVCFRSFFFFLYCIWFPSCFLRFRLNHLEFPAAEEPVPVVVTPNGWTREGGRNKEEKREHDGEIEGKLRAKQGSVQRKAKRS